jgi:hypothetical protein
VSSVLFLLLKDDASGLHGAEQLTQWPAAPCALGECVVRAGRRGVGSNFRRVGSNSEADCLASNF